MNSKCFSFVNYKRLILCRARAAGLTFLNEMGLDPGIDHLEAMREILEVQSKGGKVWTIALQFLF